MKVDYLSEIVRGPDAPIPYTEIDDIIVEDPKYVAQREVAVEAFRKVIVQQLALTPRK